MLRLLVNQTNHMFHVTSTHTRDYFFTYKVFFLIEPQWFFICGGECCKPPINVPYKCTFGAPDQGQMLDMWESQTTKSALRWLAPYCSTSYSWSCSWSFSWIYSWTHVFGIKTMTSLILDHVAIDYLYLGTSTERKICYWNCPRTRLW